MSEDSPDVVQKPPRPVTYRISEVSPPDVAILLAMLHVASLLLLGLLLAVGVLDVQLEQFLLLGAAGVMGSLLGGFLLGIGYNVIAHWHGGIRVGLVLQVDDAPSLKVCPGCGARLPGARSFCPECDHSFE